MDASQKTPAPKLVFDHRECQCSVIAHTIDLFAALDIATGKVITDLRPIHTSAEFVKFLNKINRNVPGELDVHVFVDNLSTHKTPAVHRWLLRHRRFHFHFAPTCGSWMSLVERWFAALTTKKLQRSAHGSVAELAADINNWVDQWNNNPTPFIWAKTADEILDRLARCCSAVTATEYHGASTWQDTTTCAPPKRWVGAECREPPDHGF